VLTSPVLRCLKKQLTGAEIHFATKLSFKDIVEPNPYIDKTFYLNDSLKALIKQLRAEKYDAIIDLHNNARTLLIKLHLNAPSFSFNKLNVRKWLAINFKWNVLPQKHIVDRYIETARYLGIKNDGDGLDYFFMPGGKIDSADLPLSHIHGFVAVVIGAKHYTKKLPVEKLIALCKKIKAPIILLGGAEDAALGDVIKNAAGITVFNGCGKFTLSQSASILQLAKKVVTHDTGLMHIAAALKKDITAVWGNTFPQFGMYPYFGSKEKHADMYLLNSHNFEVTGLNCRPCSKIGFERCPKKHFKCMMLQDETKIADVVSK
jgi:ADP-heptose:LPS heptosyltransferase